MRYGICVSRLRGQPAASAMAPLAPGIHQAPLGRSAITHPAPPLGLTLLHRLAVLAALHCRIAGTADSKKAPTAAAAEAAKRDGFHAHSAARGLTKRLRACSLDRPSGTSVRAVWGRLRRQTQAIDQRRSLPGLAGHNPRAKRSNNNKSLQLDELAPRQERGACAYALAPWRIAAQGPVIAV